jgi:hypothetical protein
MQQVNENRIHPQHLELYKLETDISFFKLLVTVITAANSSNGGTIVQRFSSS